MTAPPFFMPRKPVTSAPRAHSSETGARQQQPNPPHPLSKLTMPRTNDVTESPIDSCFFPFRDFPPGVSSAASSTSSSSAAAALLLLAGGEAGWSPEANGGPAPAPAPALP